MTKTDYRESSNMEDYLEAIMLLGQSKTAVRVTDLSARLDVTKPSVSAALKKLSESHLIEHVRYGTIKLTLEGAAIASDVYQRHQVLSQFLTVILQLDDSVAEKDACRIEHHLSAETLERLTEFMDFVLSRPEGHPKMLQMLHYYFKHGNSAPKGTFRG